MIIMVWKFTESFSQKIIIFKHHKTNEMKSNIVEKAKEHSKVFIFIKNIFLLCFKFSQHHLLHEQGRGIHVPQNHVKCTVVPKIMIVVRVFNKVNVVQTPKQCSKDIPMKKFIVDGRFY